MKSRVRPTYKAHYRVENWRAYERALVRRGDVTLWFSPDARAAWVVPPSGRPGGQQRFSDLAIETALTLRLVFHLPLRQTEGFVRSILTVMRAGLDAPDHTTLSRRSQLLDVAVHNLPAKGPLHLIVDSTGLSVIGEGEWAAAKHGGRGVRGWKKFHLGVDRAGVIVAHVLTDATVDDATVGIAQIGAVAGDIASVTADAAYDTVAFYEAASARHAQVAVPPTRTARVSRRGPRSRARDRVISDVETLGRREWQKAFQVRLIAAHRCSAFTKAPIWSGLGTTESLALLTVPEVATRLRTTTKAMYAMVERGQVPHIRVGRRALFSQPELAEWLRHKSIAVTAERAV